MDFTGYPRCINGDVLIILKPGDWELKLHADVQRRQSKFFRHRLTQESAATLSSSAKRAGEFVRWRYDLVERPGPGEDGPGKLQMVVCFSVAPNHLSWLWLVRARS
jgi:hypothetical protein